MALVYMATNIVNGKRYIGITCQGLPVRRSRHISAALCGNSATYFHRAIRKYGKKHFTFEVIMESSCYEEVKRHEVKFIGEMKPEYNMTVGGDGCLGWRASPEQRRANGLSKKGRPGFWKGKKLLPHVLKHMSIRNQTAERRDAWKKHGTLGPQSIRRRVVCLNDGQVYESIEDASKAYNLDPSSICSICKRDPIRKTAGGRVFRYFGDHSGGAVEAAQEKETAKRNQLDGLLSRLKK